MATLITNPSSSTSVTLPAAFFEREIGPREGLVVSDPLPAVNDALVGLGLTVEVIDTGAGDVVGPALSTDNALVRWDGVTGLLVQNSNAILQDTGELALTSLATTTNALSVIGNSLTSGQLLSLSSASADATIRDLVTITNTGSPNASLLSLTQNGAGAAALKVTGRTLLVSDETTTRALRVASNSLTTGAVARFDSSSADVSTRTLVEILSTDPLATGTTTLRIDNASPTAVGARVQMDGISTNATLGLHLRNDTASTAGAGNSENSPSIEIGGTFHDGAVSQTTSWRLQNVNDTLVTALDITRGPGAGTRFARLTDEGLDLAPSSGTGTGLQFLEVTTRPFTAAATLGSIWVRDDVPNVIVFTDDAGTDNVLSSTVGDVVGPASATDNAIARFDLTTGKLIQNSTAILSDAGEIALTSTGTTTDALNIAADSLTTGDGLVVSTNSADTGTRNTAHINQENLFATGATALRVEQTSTAVGLFIADDGDGIALNVISSAATANVISATADVLTTGSLMRLFSGSPNTSVRTLAEIENSSAVADNATCLTLRQGADGQSLNIVNTGNATAINIPNPAATTNILISVTGADDLTTGSIMSLNSDSASTGVRNLVEITNDNVAATGATALRVQQDSTADAVLVVAGANGTSIDVQAAGVTTATSVSIVDINAGLTTGTLLQVSSNSTDVSTRNLAEIINDNTAATAARCLRLQQDGGGNALLIDSLLGTAINVVAANTTNNAIDVQCDSLTTGGVATFESASTDTGTRTLVNIDNSAVLASSTTPLVVNQASGQADAVQITGAGASIRIDEISSPPVTAAAGEATFWARNNAPNRPIFTDDAGADHPLDIGYILGYGSDFATAGFFSRSHGTSMLGETAVNDEEAQLNAIVPSRLSRLSWNTAAASATTVINIHVNGVVEETETLTGAVGVLTFTNQFVLAVGDDVAIEYDAGTAPGDGTYVIYCE